MDLVLIAVVAIPFGLTATALWVAYRVSRKGKREKREVGYQREEIQINAAAVPEFKPTLAGHCALRPMPPPSLLASSALALMSRDCASGQSKA
jgi:hypothetical protein